MCIEPHIVRHHPQIHEFLYHRKILQFASEVLEMCIIRIELVFVVLLRSNKLKLHRIFLFN